MGSVLTTGVSASQTNPLVMGLCLIAERSLGAWISLEHGSTLWVLPAEWMNLHSYLEGVPVGHQFHFCSEAEPDPLKVVYSVTLQKYLMGPGP